MQYNIRSRFLNPNQSTLNKGLFLTDFDEPTYLTFKVEFGSNPGASISSDIFMTGPAYQNNFNQTNYDSMPTPLFGYPSGPSGNHYTAYDYLIDSNQATRAEMLLDFLSGFHELQTLYQYYFQSISGIHNLVKIDPARGCRVPADSIVTLTTLDSIDQKVRWLMSLYRRIAWDDIYQRWALPDAMRFFKMYIYISEVRHFHRPTSSEKVLSSLGTNPLLGRKGLTGLILKAVDDIAPVTLIECDMCEFDIKSLEQFEDNYAHSPGEESSFKIPIRVGNVRIVDSFNILKVGADSYKRSPLAEKYTYNKNYNKKLSSRLDDISVNISDRNASNSTIFDVLDILLDDTSMFNTNILLPDSYKIHESSDPYYNLTFPEMEGIIPDSEYDRDSAASNLGIRKPTDKSFAVTWVRNMIDWAVGKATDYVESFINDAILTPLFGSKVNALDIYATLQSKDIIAVYNTVMRFVNAEAGQMGVPDDIAETMFKDVVRNIAQTEAQNEEEAVFIKAARELILDNKLMEEVLNMSDAELQERLLRDQHNIHNVEDGVITENNGLLPDLDQSAPDSDMTLVDNRHDAIDIDFDLVDNRHNPKDIDFDLIDNRQDPEDIDFDLIDNRYSPGDIDFDLIDNRQDPEDIDFDLIDNRQDPDDIDFDLINNRQNPDDIDFDLIDNRQDPKDIDFDLIDNRYNPEDIDFPLTDNKADLDKNEFDLTPNTPGSEGVEGDLGAGEPGTSTDYGPRKSDGILIENSHDTKAPVFDLIENTLGLEPEGFDLIDNISDVDSIEFDLIDNKYAPDDIEFPLTDNVSDLDKNEFDLTFNTSDLDSNDFGLTDNISNLDKNEFDLIGNESDLDKNEFDLIGNASDLDKNEFDLNPLEFADIDPDRFILQDNVYELDHVEFDLTLNTAPESDNINQQRTLTSNHVTRTEHPRMELKGLESTVEYDDSLGDNLSSIENTLQDNMNIELTRLPQDIETYQFDLPSLDQTPLEIDPAELDRVQDLIDSHPQDSDSILQSNIPSEAQTHISDFELSKLDLDLDSDSIEIDMPSIEFDGDLDLGDPLVRVEQDVELDLNKDLIKVNTESADTYNSNINLESLDTEAESNNFTLPENKDNRPDDRINFLK